MTYYCGSAGLAEITYVPCVFVSVFVLHWGHSSLRVNFTIHSVTLWRLWLPFHFASCSSWIWKCTVVYPSCSSNPFPRPFLLANGLTPFGPLSSGGSHIVSWPLFAVGCADSSPSCMRSVPEYCISRECNSELDVRGRGTTRERKRRKSRADMRQRVRVFQ